MTDHVLLARKRGRRDHTITHPSSFSAFAAGMHGWAAEVIEAMEAREPNPADGSTRGCWSEFGRSRCPCSSPIGNSHRMVLPRLAHLLAGLIRMLNSGSLPTRRTGFDSSTTRALAQT